MSTGRDVVRRAVALTARASGSVRLEASFIRALRIASQHKNCRYSSEAAFSRALRCSSTANDATLRHVKAQQPLPQPSTFRSASSASSTPRESYLIHGHRHSPENTSTSVATSADIDEKRSSNNPTSLLDTVDKVEQRPDANAPHTPAHRVRWARKFLEDYENKTKRKLEDFQNQRHRHLNIPAPGWRDLFQQLASSSVPVSLERTEEFHFVEERGFVQSAQRRLASLRYLVPGQNVINDTLVPDDPSLMSLHIVGSPAYVNLVRNTLIALQRRSRRHLPLDALASQESSSNDSTGGHLAHPATPYADNFLGSITEILRPPPPRLARSSAHLESKITELMQLFRTERQSPDVISPTAFLRAIRFLLKHERIGEVRELYNQMKELGIQRPLKLYNLILRSCARTSNTRAFRSYVISMREEGHRPNAETWMALMRMTRETQQQNLIMKQLALLGYLDFPALLQKAIPLIIERRGSKPLKEELLALFELLDIAVGPTWLNYKSMSTVIDQLCRKGHVDEAHLFLSNSIQDGKIKPRSYFVESLMIWCKRFKLVDTAVKILVGASKEWGFKSDSSTTASIFFGMAWDCRMHNVGKVAWKHMLLRGRLTPDQIRRVMWSLSVSTETGPSSVRGRFQRQAGRVYVGREGLITVLGSDISPSEMASRVMDAELATYGKEDARRRFFQDLVDALQKDKEWRKHAPGAGDKLFSAGHQGETPRTLAQLAVEVRTVERAIDPNLDIKLGL